MALKPIQQRFVDEYLIDLNATAAYKRAGYKGKGHSAEAAAARLLSNVEVDAAIKAAEAARSKRTEITQDRVLQEYAKLAFLDPRKFFHPNGSPKDITELDDDTAAALSGIEVLEQYEGHGEDRQFVGYVKKYKLIDKKGALDSVARHLGMFNDSLKVSASVAVVAVNELDQKL